MPVDQVVAIAAPWMRRPDEGGEGKALSRLLASGWLEEQLALVSRQWQTEACAKAAASVWSKSLFAALKAAPALAAIAGFPQEQDPALWLEEDNPVAMIARHPSGFLIEPSLETFAAYLGHTVAAAISRLSQASGLAERVFWSNAATMLAYLCEGWARLPLASGRAERLRAMAFDGAHLPRSSLPNPLEGQVSYVPCAVPGWDVGARRRKICCLRDLIGQPLCASCPKIAVEARDALLAAASH